MKGLPSRSSSFCATSRANRSEPPPAANGTTMVTGRDGYCCAPAGSTSAARSAKTQMPTRIALSLRDHLSSRRLAQPVIFGLSLFGADHRIQHAARLQLRRIGGDMDQPVERAVDTVCLHRF